MLSWCGAEYPLHFANKSVEADLWFNFNEFDKSFTAKLFKLFIIPGIRDASARIALKMK